MWKGTGAFFQGRPDDLGELSRAQIVERRAHAGLAAMTRDVKIAVVAVLKLIHEVLKFKSRANVSIDGALA